MQRCILLKSSFLGSGRASCLQCWQYWRRSLQVEWHLQGRKWMLSSKSQSQRQQFSISFRKTMKDSLNRLPVSLMQMRGLLMRMISYWEMGSFAKQRNSSSVRTFSIFSEKYSPWGMPCSLIMLYQLKMPLSLAMQCVYFRLRLQKSRVLMRPWILDSSGTTSEYFFIQRQLLIFRQQPLLQLGSVITARSAQIEQELKSRSSNRQAAVLLQRMDLFLGLGPRMWARDCSYLRMASTYFLFLKKKLACSLSWSLLTATRSVVSLLMMVRYSERKMSCGMNSFSTSLLKGLATLICTLGMRHSCMMQVSFLSGELTATSTARVCFLKGLLSEASMQVQ